MDERYLSKIEQSRTSPKPLPLEVIENVQEAIWSGISASVRAVLHRLVDMALADEATERVGAGRHERTAARRAHRNGTYTRDLATTLGPIEDIEVPRVRMPDGSSPGGWQTFDRYERRTYELDRLIGQLFLAGVSGKEPGAGLRRALGEEGLALDRVASHGGLRGRAAGDQRGSCPR